MDLVAKVRAGIGYARRRYQRPGNASGWYANGGDLPSASGGRSNDTGRPEAVLSAAQLRAITGRER